MERKSQHSSLALKSRRTGVSLYRRRRRGGGGGRRRRRRRRRRSLQRNVLVQTCCNIERLYIMHTNHVQP
jgi:hypothetical protein